MRNRLGYISAALFVMFAVSCQKAGLEEAQTQDSSPSEVEYNKLTFTLDPVSAPTTKVTLGEIKDGKQAVKWEVGDRVYIMRKDGDSGDFWANSVSEDGLSAEFYGLSFWSGGKFRAVYPSGAIDQRTTGPHRAYDTFVADLPDTQTYREGSFGKNAGLCMAEWDEDLGELRTMKNLTGALRLSIKGNFRVGKIVLVDNDEDFPLTGCYFAATGEFGKQRAEEICNVLTLDCGTLGVMLNSETPVDFHFALPPGALAKGFEAYIYDLNGNIVSNLSTTKANTITASVIKAMPVITSNTDLYPGNPVLLETVGIDRGYYTETVSQVRAQVGDMLEEEYGMNSNREYTYNCIKHIVFETGVNKPCKWLFAQDFCLNSIYGSFDTETGTLYFSTEAEGFEMPGNAAFMFSGFTNLQDITGLDKVSSENTWNFSNLFENCLSFESINLGNLDTSHAEYLSAMFKGCSKLASIDLSGFVTSGTYDMSSMFEDCRSLTSIDVSSFDISSLESCSKIFSGCTKLSSLVLGQNFSLSDRCDYSYMLTGAGSMTDDNTLTISCVPSFKAIFDREEEGRYDGRDSNLGTRAPREGDYGCINYVFNILDAPTVMSIDAYNDENINSELKALCNNGMAPEYGIDHQVKKIVFIPNSTIDNPRVETDIVAVWDADTQTLSLHDSYKYWWGRGTNGNFDIYYLEGLFSGFAGLEEIVGLEYVNLSNSRNYSIASLFKGCSSLESVDMSGVDALGVCNMTSLFEGCTALRSVITSKAFSIPEDNCSDMFKDAAPGATISITCTESAKAAIIASGTYSCGFNWTIITPTVTMASGKDFKNSILAIAGSEPYYGTSINTTIKALRFVTGQTDVESGTFAYDWNPGTGTMTIRTSESQITPPSDMSYMFSDLEELQVIGGLGCFDISNVTDMNHLFNCCYNLTEFDNGDISGWNTSKVKDMSYIFRNTSSLGTLPIENWNTSSVSLLDRAFDSCGAFNLDLTKWDVSKVTSMNCLFMCSYSLKSVDISTWNTSSVIDFNNFYANCRLLERVVLGNDFIINPNAGHINFLEDAGYRNATGKLEITCPVDATWNLISATHTGSTELIRVQ